VIDENLSLMCAHRNNIARYRKMLKTSLTDLERQFVERRLAEEQSAMEKIAASTFPLAFRLPASPTTDGELAVPHLQSQRQSSKREG
jgi:hypothetical protein